MRKMPITARCLAVILFVSVIVPVAGQSASAAGPSFEPLIGEWVRPDGGYVIQVLSIQDSGAADVGYFNPGRINVSDARVSMWEGYMKLFIKLQDKGYPGSTYTLYYYKDKDALAGFYYQAVTKQTYEVIFIRKK